MKMRAVAGKMPLFVTDMLRLAFLPCRPTSRARSHVPEMSRPPCSAMQCNQDMCASPQLVQLCCRPQRHQCICAHRLFRARSSLHLAQHAQVSMDA